MDLYACGQIESLDELAKANGIQVERLRGYRLMADERPYSEEKLAECLNELVGEYWWMAAVEQDHRCCPDCTDFIKGYRPPSIPKGCAWPEYYGEDAKEWEDTDSKFWKVKRVHRTSLFQELGMLKARFKRQYMLWNRYVGQPDVLYIHARIGGSNWKGYYSDDERAEREIHDGWWIERQPWFICKCDDAFDPTYCDIYARIDGGVQ